MFSIDVSAARHCITLASAEYHPEIDFLSGDRSKGHILENTPVARRISAGVVSTKQRKRIEQLTLVDCEELAYHAEIFQPC